MKKKAKPDYYASCGAPDNYGTLYESMCKSEAYKKLSPTAKVIYMLCRVNAQSRNGRACIFKHASEIGRKYSENCFVFPDKQIKEYGYDGGNVRRLYIPELIEAGFIEYIERNGNTRDNNVYAFSDKWKERKWPKKI